MGYRVKPFTMAVRDNSTQQFIDVGLLGSDVAQDIEEVEQHIDEVEDKLDKRAQWVTPEEFGAVGDGVTDDSSAIQVMFDSMVPGQTALFGKQVYLIESPITITTSFINITGGFARSEFFTTLRTHLSSGVLITIRASGLGISNIFFEGNITTLYNNDNIALVKCDADNETLSGNCDHIFTNCGFFKASKGLIVRGRNVRVSGSIFSSMARGYCIEQTTLDTDNRGYHIDNNRFHSVNVCVFSEAQNSRTNKNLIIINNFCDFMITLYSGKDAGAFIKNNVALAIPDIAASLMITIGRDTPDTERVWATISNNVFVGSNVTTQNYIIGVNSAYAIINGNVFQKCHNGAVTAMGQADVIVKDNILNNVAITGANVMNFVDNASGIAKGNIINNCSHTTINVGANATIVVSDNDIC